MLLGQLTVGYSENNNKHVTILFSGNMQTFYIIKRAAGLYAVIRMR
jgi:hypothetical protein